MIISKKAIKIYHKILKNRIEGQTTMSVRWNHYQVASATRRSKGNLAKKREAINNKRK